MGRVADLIFRSGPVRVTLGPPGETGPTHSSGTNLVFAVSATPWAVGRRVASRIADRVAVMEEGTLKYMIGFEICWEKNVEECE